MEDEIMNELIQAVKNFWNNEEGMTAVEYALIVAIMATAIILAWNGTLGPAVQNSMQSVATALGTYAP